MDVKPLRRAAAALAALVLLSGLATGCARQSSDEAVQRSSGGSTAPSVPAPTEEYAYDKEQSSPSSPGTDGTAAADRMIIRTQTMRLEVESTPDTIETLRDLAKQHEAVITDLQVATDADDWIYRYDQSGYASGDGAPLRGWVTVRVPAASLEAFVDAAMDLGTVKHQSEGTEDVTQQHIDLSARLANLRAEEERLRSFFDAAANVQEMLAVEVELNRVRGEIESLDAQVTYLERQAAMATVTIELTEEKPLVRPEGDSWGFREAITAGVRGAAAVVNFAIAFVIATAPLWAIGIVAFFIVRSVLRRRRARRLPEHDAE